MPVFISWVRKKINKQHKNALPNGILYLKGGDLTEEMRPVQTFHESHLISDNFSEAFFETKKVVYVQLYRSEEHTSELQSRPHLVCRLLLEKKNNKTNRIY